MLRIGICDDECYARDALRLELEKLLEETEEIVYEFSWGEVSISIQELASKASRRDRPSVSGCGDERG